MRKLKTSRTTAAIAATFLLAPLAGIAWAGGMGGHGSHDGDHCKAGSARYERHHGERHHGRMGRHGEKDMNLRLDGRMAFLKAEIAITPEQEDQWKAVEDVLRAGIERRTEHFAERRGKRDEAGQQSAPDRLAGHIAAMEARLAQMKSMQGALNDLYAVLDESQRATANELLPGAGKGHRFMGRLR